MSYRGRLDEPGFMEGILADIDALPREFWLGLIDKYENEKPGDIVLPGVPPRENQFENASRADAPLPAHNGADAPSRPDTHSGRTRPDAQKSSPTAASKKPSRKVRKAA